MLCFCNFYNVACQNDGWGKTEKVECDVCFRISLILFETVPVVCTDVVQCVKPVSREIIPPLRTPVVFVKPFTCEVFTAATANSTKLEHFFTEMLQKQVDSSQLNIFVVLPSNNTSSRGKIFIKKTTISPLPLIIYNFVSISSTKCHHFKNRLFLGCRK